MREKGEIMSDKRPSVKVATSKKNQVAFQHYPRRAASTILY